MNQELIFETTNYLDPYTFYNKFLFWVVRLEPFTTSSGKPPMNADGFVALFRTEYGTGSRISDLTNSKRRDFDLNHRIWTIPKAKTGYNQRTTILPYDIDMLEKHFAIYSKDDSPFPVNRHLVWDYAKNAGRLAGLNISEIQKQKVIDGIWTHLLRKSCSKRMKALDAGRELRMLKLRHAMRDAHDAYDLPDINALLEWEDKQWGSQRKIGMGMLN